MLKNQRIKIIHRKKVLAGKFRSENSNAKSHHDEVVQKFKRSTYLSEQNKQDLLDELRNTNIRVPK
ncbi:hypothetical protein [Lactiplantibacillus fabifermentans]|uniref:Uncharacterized protein n=1 Tax=Lactiplantibacillus fabifermentans T30PCM01 TaxID=1400520 RepID=W6TC70_9LACO|nr:hypothetical protein [Lactiplantibacillus fabifermentans]ETY73875.1 hypothetical protein LFAB_10160 [Lactiplantibacillus fabifermentans T30PCM01]